MNELAKLRWQCRRGILELDLLLTRYLENGYVSATDEEKALFVELLTFEDDVLLEILMGGVVNPPARMKSVINSIRNP
jgi:antitoxin CptB